MSGWDARSDGPRNYPRFDSWIFSTILHLGDGSVHERKVFSDKEESLRPYQKQRQYPLTSALRALAAVAQHGSITRAVSHSDYTLEGTLTALRNLETREGIRLLIRNTNDQRRLALSSDGERLARWAINWFQSLDELLTELKKIE